MFLYKKKLIGYMYLLFKKHLYSYPNNSNTSSSLFL